MEKVQITYTDCGHFYGAYIHENETYYKKHSWVSFNKWLSSVNIQGKAGRFFDTESLTELCEEIQSKGYEAEFDNYFDPS